MPTPTKALLFDLDNTLIDREQAFIRFATSFYEDNLSALTSTTQDKVVTKMVLWDQDGYADRATMFAKWAHEWPEADLDPKQLLPWYRTEMKNHVQRDPEVNALLTDLNSYQVPWGIVTNGNTTSQHVACRAAGLDRLAPFVIVSQQAGYRKPDPRIFRDAIDLTGIDSPENVMFVGDNPHADIDGAKKFGMKTAWVRRGRQFPNDLQPPDHEIDHVAELRNIVNLFA